MRMRFYKTFGGFMRTMKGNQVKVEDFLNGRVYKHGVGTFNFKLSDEAMREGCEIISKEIYSSRKSQKDAFHAMLNNLGDAKYFHCFTIEHGRDRTYISNSLSGEAYDYCKRMFLKSTR